MPSTISVVGHPRKPGEKTIEASVDKTNDRLNSKVSDKTKNVSHVPCKFFKQSMCQAGDKCPFSHELEADTQAVCKYFQRGNCRFGSKCALAHITPDGRRVNKKPSREPRKKERGKDERKLDKPFKEGGEDEEDDAGAHHVYASTDQAPALSTAKLVQPVSLSASGLEGSHRYVLAPPGSALKTKTGSDGSFGSDSTVADSSVELASQILSKYSGASPPQTRGGLHEFSARSFSASLPRQGWAGMPLGISEGSAVYDDDDTLEEQEYDETEEEEGYKEQLVPSTLQDLLTPLERERRNSRNSQQKSGRVFSSPASSAQPPFDLRRGSTGSEPIGAASPNTLWGPRNSVTPFYRTGQFGSPPIAHSQLASPGLTSPQLQQHSTLHSTYQHAASPPSSSSMMASFGLPSLGAPSTLRTQTGGVPFGTSNGIGTTNGNGFPRHIQH